MALADGSFADFTLFAEHIRQAPVIRLDGHARVFDGYALVVDELGCHGGNVDLAPTIGNGAIPALDVRHGGGQFLVILNFKELIHAACGFLIAGHAIGQGIVGAAVKHGQDIGVGLRMPGNQAQLAVHMGNQVLQRLVNFALGVPALEGELLAIRKERALNNRPAQVLQRGGFILAGFLLLVADDVLYGFGKLHDIALLHIFANFHGDFQGFVIRRLCQYYSGVPALRLGHKPEVRLHVGIGSNGQKPQTHTAGKRTHRRAVHHLIEGKIILVVVIFLRRIDVAKDHVPDTLHNSGGIHRRVLDFALNVLFFIGQEAVNFSGTGDVILAHQAV